MLPRLVPKEQNGYSLRAHFALITQMTQMSQLFLIQQRPIRDVLRSVHAVAVWLVEDGAR